MDENKSLEQQRLDLHWAQAENQIHIDMNCIFGIVDPNIGSVKL